jgi:outer membrane protein
MRLRLLVIPIISSSVYITATPVTYAETVEGSSSTIAGFGAEISPRYLGSTDYRVSPIPYFSWTSPRGLFVDSLKGAGITVSLPYRFFFETAVNYGPGRKDENKFWQNGSGYLRGMGNIPDTAIFTATAGYRLGSRGTVSISADLPLTDRDRGENYRANLKYEVAHIGNDRLLATAEADLGSVSYNQTFFGVTRTQSLNSGFPVYEVHSGLYAVRAGVTWIHPISEHWSISSMAAVTYLTGDEASSPITQRRASLVTDVVASYRF